MASDLFQELQDGERVVWRDAPRRSIVLFWVTVIGGMGLALAVALGIAIAQSGIEASGKVYLVLAVVFGFLLLGVLMAGLAVSLGDARESQVSNRRVLLRRRNEHDQDIVTAIPLAEVTGVTLVDGELDLCVKITRRGDADCVAEKFKRAQDLAFAIADGAGVPRPAPVGRLEYLPSTCFWLGILVAWMAYTFAMAAEPLRAIDDRGLRVAASILVVGASAGGGWLLPHLAALIAVAALPAYASAEEARTWFRLKPANTRRRWLRLKAPIYRWLAGRVYGEAMGPEEPTTGSEGVEANGA